MYVFMMVYADIKTFIVTCLCILFHISKQKRIRAGHRSYIKKLFGTTDELLSAKTLDVYKVECMKISLTDKISTLQRLDDATLLLIEEENIVKEIEEAGEFKEMI